MKTKQNIEIEARFYIDWLGINFSLKKKKKTIHVYGHRVRAKRLSQDEEGHVITASGFIKETSGFSMQANCNFLGCILFHFIF